MKKKLTLGILAHVDAGKTTLSEALLFACGRIRSLGRVDHKNTYLDTHAVERERGITIFSKQARFSTDACDFILLDTPGHVDFSAETERTLALLDYAILVISATDGVQNHTRTLWQLLEHYDVPTFVFVNKTDQALKTRAEMTADVARTLSPLAVAFHDTQTKAELDEELATVCEEFLESFALEIPIDNAYVAQKIAERRLFPVLFGSALRMTGIDFLLNALDTYTLPPPRELSGFGARVYKIIHAGGTRLTYLKLTRGKLSARDEIVYLSPDGKRHAEKITQIRLYSGEKFESTDSVEAGEICAVCGLSATYAGLGLGDESDTCKPLLEPVLSYRVGLPDDCDPIRYLPLLKELEEEEPSLHLYWNDELRQIEARLMGEIQIDLLRRLIRDRLSIDCDFDVGKILYKERIAKKTVGIGHFEPLRHYAEVQLLMESLPTGSGLIFDTRLSENSLETNWQRLILSHLYEKKHRGVLIGAALTDTRITLVAGKAHQKHTDGGDFREATLRAVRHGLMKAGCELLEPYYRFRLELPNNYVGHAMSDLQARFSDFSVESANADKTVIVGRGPVSELRDYPREVISYTRGQGQIYCTPDGYAPCHDQDKVVTEVGYDPEADLENTPHSVFCAHGAGLVVPWNEVDNYKHLDAGIQSIASQPLPTVNTLAKKYNLSDDELEAIMLREFGPIKRRRYTEKREVSCEKGKHRPQKTPQPQKRLVIIDGYNVIYAWESLRETAACSLEKAREALMDMLSNYVAFTKTELVLVFDA